MPNRTVPHHKLCDCQQNSVAAREAWCMVAQAIHQIGGDQTVVFDDPLTHTVIQAMGGWIQLCQMRRTEQRVYQRLFEMYYAHYQKHRPPYHLKQLVGRMDAANQAQGYSVLKSPILIGDPKRAVTVWRTGHQVNPLQSYHRLLIPEGLIVTHSSQRDAVE